MGGQEGTWDLAQEGRTPHQYRGTEQPEISRLFLTASSRLGRTPHSYPSVLPVSGSATVTGATNNAPYTTNFDPSLVTSPVEMTSAPGPTRLEGISPGSSPTGGPRPWSTSFMTSALTPAHALPDRHMPSLREAAADRALAAALRSLQSPQTGMDALALATRRMGTTSNPLLEGGAMGQPMPAGTPDAAKRLIPDVTMAESKNVSQEALLWQLLRAEANSLGGTLDLPQFGPYRGSALSTSSAFLGSFQDQRDVELHLLDGPSARYPNVPASFVPSLRTQAIATVLSHQEGAAGGGNLGLMQRYNNPPSVLVDHMGLSRKRQRTPPSSVSAPAWNSVNVVQETKASPGETSLQRAQSVQLPANDISQVESEPRCQRQASNREAARRMRKRHADRVADLQSEVDAWREKHGKVLDSLAEARETIGQLEETNRQLVSVSAEVKLDGDQSGMSREEQHNDELPIQQDQEQTAEDSACILVGGEGKREVQDFNSFFMDDSDFEAFNILR